MHPANAVAILNEMSEAHVYRHNADILKHIANTVNSMHMELEEWKAKFGHMAEMRYDQQNVPFLRLKPIDIKQTLEQRVQMLEQEIRFLKNK